MTDDKKQDAEGSGSPQAPEGTAASKKDEKKPEGKSKPDEKPKDESADTSKGPDTSQSTASTEKESGDKPEADEKSGKAEDEPSKTPKGPESDDDKKDEESGETTHEDLLRESAPKQPEKPPEEEPEEEPEGPAEPEEEQDTKIFALRTTANREDQVLSFVGSNAARKKIPVYTVISPHGMRGYVFVEAKDQLAAEEASKGVPYAKGVIPKEIDYKEIEHMLEQVKKDIKIQKNDIVEIIAGPFKREKAKITRVDKAKEEVVVELLEAAVPIPITLKLDDVKVIRREE